MNAEELYASYCVALKEQLEMAAEVRRFYARLNDILETLVARGMLRQSDVTKFLEFTDCHVASLLFKLETIVAANGSLYEGPSE
jgi:hypothetical protein